jgi:hypothetical protein
MTKLRFCQADLTVSELLVKDLICGTELKMIAKSPNHTEFLKKIPKNDSAFCRPSRRVSLPLIDRAVLHFRGIFL